MPRRTVDKGQRRARSNSRSIEFVDSTRPGLECQPAQYYRHHLRVKVQGYRKVGQKGVIPTERSERRDLEPAQFAEISRLAFGSLGMTSSRQRAIHGFATTLGEGPPDNAVHGRGWRDAGATLARGWRDAGPCPQCFAARPPLAIVDATRLWSRCQRRDSYSLASWSRIRRIQSNLEMC